VGKPRTWEGQCAGLVTSALELTCGTR